MIYSKDKGYYINYICCLQKKKIKYKDTERLSRDGKRYSMKNLTQGKLGVVKINIREGRL